MYTVLSWEMYDVINEYTLDNLPEGWEERVDRNSGRKYYLNHIHKTTQWKKPTEPASASSSVKNVGWIYSLKC